MDREKKIYVVADFLSFKNQLIWRLSQHHIMD